MKSNVFSTKEATASYSTELYHFNPQKVPLGVYKAKLDFKTWSKRILAINGYFTKLDSGEKFVLTIYCNYLTGRFQLPHSVIDFSSCPIGEIYRIHVDINGKGKIVLEKADFL